MFYIMETHNDNNGAFAIYAFTCIRDAHTFDHSMNGLSVGIKENWRFTTIDGELAASIVFTDAAVRLYRMTKYDLNDGVMEFRSVNCYPNTSFKVDKCIFQ